MILFSAVAANHLGLVAAVERVLGHSIPVVNCPKCLTFWSVLAYGLAAEMPDSGAACLPSVTATALLCAYLASWLELLMGFADTLYNRIYEQIYPTADTPADDQAGAGGSVPGLWIDYGDGEDPGAAGTREDRKKKEH